MGILPPEAPSDYDMEVTLQLLPTLQYYASEAARTEEGYRSRRYQGHSGISIKIVSARWLPTEQYATKVLSNAGGVPCWQKVTTHRKARHYLFARQRCRASLFPLPQSDPPTQRPASLPQTVPVDRVHFEPLLILAPSSAWSHCASLRFV